MVFDGDARRTGGSGQAQGSAEPAPEPAPVAATGDDDA